ncbi:MAG TPA: type II toxin-antitoxin system YafQ family toxin [Alphaproteobacteria bacterium]|nr:type II toxin-antitoxin system YafQ family toxin [Alphaproteobacteria bacterium]
MLELYIEGHCKKDIKRAHKRGKDMRKFWGVVELLQKQLPLEARHRDHPLKGEWSPCRDCHIEPDWLLIYYVKAGFLYLARTGTHADLFE